MVTISLNSPLMEMHPPCARTNSAARRLASTGTQVAGDFLHPRRPVDRAVMVVAGGVDQRLALAFVEVIEGERVLVFSQARFGLKSSV